MWQLPDEARTQQQILTFRCEVPVYRRLFSCFVRRAARVSGFLFGVMFPRSAFLCRPTCVRQQRRPQTARAAEICLFTSCQHDASLFLAGEPAEVSARPDRLLPKHFESESLQAAAQPPGGMEYLVTRLHDEGKRKIFTTQSSPGVMAG